MLMRRISNKSYPNPSKQHLQLNYQIKKGAYCNTKGKQIVFGNAIIEPGSTEPGLSLPFSGYFNWVLHLDKVCGKAIKYSS